MATNKKLPTTVAELFKRAGDYKGASAWNTARKQAEEYKGRCYQASAYMALARRAQQVRLQQLGFLLAKVLPDQAVDFGTRSPVITISDGIVTVVSCGLFQPGKGEPRCTFFDDRGRDYSFEELTSNADDAQQLLDALQKALEKKLRAELTEILK